MKAKNADFLRKQAPKCEKTGDKTCNNGSCKCRQPATARNLQNRPHAELLSKCKDKNRIHDMKNGECEGNAKAIGPVFPLSGDVKQQRKAVKRLIGRADPVTVQIVLALLKQVGKKQRMASYYLAGWQAAEKEWSR